MEQSLSSVELGDHVETGESNTPVTCSINDDITETMKR